MACPKATPLLMLILRLVGFMLLAASLIVMAIDSFTNTVGEKQEFSIIVAYRFMLAIVVAGLAYGLLQLPLSVYYACKRERVSSSRFWQQFDFYGDKVVNMLLAMGIGAGLATGFELKRFTSRLSQFLLTNETELRRFLDQGNVATGLLFLGSICVFIASVLSSVEVASESSGDEYWWAKSSSGRRAKTIFVPLAARAITWAITNQYNN